MTATFLPFFSLAPAGLIPISLAVSATNLSSLPIETGSPLIPLIHLPSHCDSCGQTRPQTAGSADDSEITLYASSTFPVLTCSINAGILIATGHPLIHCAFLQLRHLLASSIASSLL